MLFLKVYDAKEQDWEFDDEAFVSIIPETCRWQNWAHDDKSGTAMTGEITLRGKVLPVGGIKEKILAAKRAGITDIILSADNRKDVNDISEIYLKGLTFHYVTTMLEVFNIAITDEPAVNAIKLS